MSIPDFSVALFFRECVSLQVFVSPWDGSVISLLDRFLVEQTVLFFFFLSKADSSVRPDRVRYQDTVLCLCEAFAPWASFSNSVGPGRVGYQDGPFQLIGPNYNRAPHWSLGL